MAKLRELTNAEIEKLASTKGVRRIAVENFLMSMGDNPFAAQMNLSQDAQSYGWNFATVQTIRKGINMATTSGGKMKKYSRKDLAEIKKSIPSVLGTIKFNPEYKNKEAKAYVKWARKVTGGGKKGWHGERLRHKIARLKGKRR